MHFDPSRGMTRLPRGARGRPGRKRSCGQMDSWVTCPPEGAVMAQGQANGMGRGARFWSAMAVIVAVAVVGTRSFLHGPSSATSSAKPASEVANERPAQTAPAVLLQADRKPTDDQILVAPERPQLVADRPQRQSSVVPFVNVSTSSAPVRTPPSEPGQQTMPLPPPPAPATATPPLPGDAARQDYASALRHARFLIKAKLYPLAEESLRKIVKEAEGTAAA